MHFVAIATAHLLRGRYGMCGEDSSVQQDEQITATRLQFQHREGEDLTLFNVLNLEMYIKLIYMVINLLELFIFLT